MVCIGLSGVNTIISLGVVFGFIAVPQLRAYAKMIIKNPPLLVLVVILLLSGTIQIKMICP